MKVKDGINVTISKDTWQFLKQIKNKHGLHNFSEAIELLREK